MARKRHHRQAWPALPPRGMRPRLTQQQLQDLSLANHQNLEALAKGQADEDILWQWVGGCLTWCRVADVLSLGLEEMNAQLQLVVDVVTRYGRTGRAVFTGPEYQLAKLGVGYMDDLAQIVDQATATAATVWAEARCNAMAAQHPSRRKAA